ncbi:MAG: sugar ABC transporter permease [Erysipelotrichaceae bacterium]|nr:sugar ABC transporter permease [Erysipelotrichaceae bacterium]
MANQSTTALASRKKEKNIFRRFLGKIGDYFRSIGQALVHGDVWTKLSFLISGLGYFVHGHEQEFVRDEIVRGEDGHPDVITVKFRRYVNQWLRGLFYLALEAAAVLVLVFVGIPNFAKLGLNDIVLDKDDSFLILLQSVVTILVLVLFLFLHLGAVRGVYQSELAVKEGRPIKSALQDLHDLIDDRFYVTVLALPIIGILAFTLIPTIMMILIAFTNYGASGIGSSNFSWVGGANWGSLFGLGGGAEFAEVFGKQLLWTLLWAFFATFTCFFGGLLLALLLNSRRTRFTKVWRTGFVITIAVPQFVSLMLIRYFLGDYGIVNNLLVETWHVIDKPIGFLSDPLITKFTIILVNCWVGFPYLMLMISGILLNIPADLYESASIDGASRPRMFWSITMPYILQVCTPYLISSFVSNINNFNVIYLLTMDAEEHEMAYQAVNAKQSDLLITWLYNMISAGGATPRYYMASIIGIIMFTISTIFTLIAFNLSQRTAQKGRKA